MQLLLRIFATQSACGRPERARASKDSKSIDVEEEHVYTCAQATARFLAEKKPQGTAFVIGEGGLLNALHDYGYSIVDKDPDYVVVGEGRIISKSLA
jgi:NagD protein